MIRTTSLSSSLSFRTAAIAGAKQAGFAEHVNPRHVQTDVPPLRQTDPARRPDKDLALHRHENANPNDGWHPQARADCQIAPCYQSGHSPFVAFRPHPLRRKPPCRDGRLVWATPILDAKLMWALHCEFQVKLRPVCEAHVGSKVHAMRRLCDYPISCEGRHRQRAHPRQSASPEPTGTEVTNWDAAQTSHSDKGTS